MIKGLTFFTKKIKTMAQTTIPITTALAIIIVLTGTTTVGVVSVWAGTFPGPNGQIAFVRSSVEEGESFEIYVMNADDDSGQTRLTDNDADDEVPDWGTNASPPGSGGSTTPSEQAIDEAISTIQDLDLVPQSLKTDIIALLEEVSNMVNDDIQITIDQIMARFLVPQ
jgi:hypothetical protein